MDNQQWQFEYWSIPKLTYGQFCEAVGRNENSVRSWIKDHLRNVGYKKDSGRMLYSGLDAIVTSIFAQLVIEQSIPPASAKFISLYASNRVRELAQMNAAQAKKVQQNPRFMVVNAVKEDWGQGHRAATLIQVGKIVESSEVPLLVIPIDRLTWNTMEKVKAVAAS